MLMEAYGSTVSPLMSSILQTTTCTCSFYRDFYIATGQLASGFNRRSRGFLVANTHITSIQQKGWGTSFVVATKFTALLNLFLELIVVHRGL